ncbi:MAG TPA: hypothetical protein VII06_07495 [Chloroflexota bacterium]|jgi:hypothetical protein
MIRRLAIGTIAAAALLGVGFAGHAQAQSSCTYAGNSGCAENRFNESPDPRDPQPVVQIAGQAQMPPQAASQAASQAAPQTDVQPAAEE